MKGLDDTVDELSWRCLGLESHIFIAATYRLLGKVNSRHVFIASTNGFFSEVTKILVIHLLVGLLSDRADIRVRDGTLVKHLERWERLLGWLVLGHRFYLLFRDWFQRL